MGRPRLHICPPRLERVPGGPFLGLNSYQIQYRIESNVSEEGSFELFPS